MCIGYHLISPMNRPGCQHSHSPSFLAAKVVGDSPLERSPPEKRRSRRKESGGGGGCQLGGLGLLFIGGYWGHRVEILKNFEQHGNRLRKPVEIALLWILHRHSDL